MNVRVRTLSGSARHYLPIGVLVLITGMFLGFLCLPALEGAAESVLPVSGSVKGWVMDGRISRFNPDNLYTYINGEAELYIPYGFSTLESARYTKVDDPKTALVADIFKMGSLVDAFGIYSRYFNREARKVDIGAGGFMDESELMFYKEDYFVRLSTSGDRPMQDVFVGFARIIANGIGDSAKPPKELELLRIPGVIPGTEKYYPSSVLGYPFFKRGFTADAKLSGKEVRIFVVMDRSSAEAKETLDRYHDYLKEKDGNPRFEKKGETLTLVGRDPLYESVLVRRSGTYVFGIVRLSPEGDSRRENTGKDAGRHEKTR